MTALLIIVWAIFGFVAGAIGLTELAGIPAREGQAGYFAIFVGGPMGALCGGVWGFLVSQKYADNLRAKRLWFGLPLGILLFAGAGAFAYETWRTWDWIDSFGGEKSLGWRVRLPKDDPTPAGKSAGFELRSEKENVTCKVYDYPHGMTREEGRWVISGDCKLRYATAKRELWARIAGGPNLIFRLRIPARYEVVPYSVSAWYVVDEVLDTAVGSARRKPKPEEAGYEVLLSAR